MTTSDVNGAIVLVRHIIGLIIVWIVTALGAAVMPMASTSSHEAEFFPYQEAFTADHTSVHFAARAPPTTVPNVAATGDVTVKHGGAFVTDGAET